MKNDAPSALAGPQPAAQGRLARTEHTPVSSARRRAQALFSQTAILDTLPAHVALIDGKGEIITVNRAWQDFGAANGLSSPQHGVGLNYLAVLDAAKGAEQGEAAEIAVGLRAVLAGQQASFSVEYPCHSPTERRWFLLTVTAIGEQPQAGAVVMHSNITGPRLIGEALRQSLARLALASESGHIGIWEWDVLHDRLEWNAQMFALYGVDRSRFAGAYEAWQHGLHPEDRGAAHEAIRAALSGDRLFDTEFRVIWPNGEVRHIEAHALVERADDGSAIRMIGVNWDITARKAAQALIQRQNRAHALLSGISGLIVRAQHRDQLFADCCQLVVEGNAFRMVMIAVPDADNTRLMPIAFAGGDDALMESLLTTLRAPLDAGSAMARAMAAQKPWVSEDLRREPCLQLCEQQAQYGVRAMAAFPLIAAGQLLGVMSFYSSDTEAFAPQELKLLTTLADDLAFATDHLDKRARLAYVTHHDALTGLPNRRLFLEHTAEYIRRGSASSHGLAVCLFDIERFSQVNATQGLAAGDSLLRQVGNALSQTLANKTLVAKVGADQFAFLIAEAGGADSAGEKLNALLATVLANTYRLNGEAVRVDARVGVALFPGDGDHAETLFKNAEVALSHAKAGAQRTMFYTATMSEALIGRVTMERRLRDALNRGEFLLHYQPKTDLGSGKVSSAEALIRWQDPLRGLVPPGQFIPVLEQTGLIQDVGRWALKQALMDARRWRAQGLGVIRVAVNVSALQIRNQGFFDDIEALLADDAGSAQHLELEITESVIVEEAHQSVERLRTLRGAGVTVAIDDFGTGYSSLSYLSKLPVDSLKIDRSFVIDMTSGPQGLALVSTILHLANALKLKVVAEGVETEEQANILRLLGCQEMQGWLVSKAVPAEEFEVRFLQGASAPVPASASLPVGR